MSNLADTENLLDWQAHRPPSDDPPTAELLDDFAPRVREAVDQVCTCSTPDPARRAYDRDHNCTIHPPF